MKSIIKIFLIFLIFFSVTISFVGNATEVNAGVGVPTCAGGDGCLPTCVADPDCVAGCVVDGTAGLIPCGRSCDDSTTAWNESEDCTLCHGILMSQLIIEFLVKLAGVAAMIAIAIGGFLYMFAAGNQGAIDTAKSVIKNVLIGFILVFIAWALIDTILTMFGYIDPVGGDWYEMDC